MEDRENFEFSAPQISLEATTELRLAWSAQTARDARQAERGVAGGRRWSGRTAVPKEKYCGALTKNGSTLLYSLLVLAALSAASLALSGSVISSLKQAQAIDAAVKAYYAANAGAEEGLYNFRKLGDTVASLNGSATLPNKSSWVRTAQGNEDSITTSLKANESFQLDIYDPENSLTALASTARSIKLNWTGPGNEWVETSYVPWKTDGTVYDITSKKVFGSSAQPAVINLIGPAYLYKMRIKALYADISDLTVSAYSGFGATGTQVPIPGRLKMKITGTSAETYQAVEVTMPQKNPASSLYDYVIFSEDPLIK